MRYLCLKYSGKNLAITILRAITSNYSFNDIQYFEEVPLGTGSVDFPSYLKALEEIGYKGFLTIERECGEDPAADISLAADFLREHIAKGKNA